MALDEALLNLRLIPTLRFYQWDQPTVSLGRFQNREEIKKITCSAPDLTKVRRRTGGKAILHYQEITYSLCAPEKKTLSGGPAKAMASIHTALAKELSSQIKQRIYLRGRKKAHSDIPDSPWCFEDSSAYDLMLNNKKLLGSAAKRTAGWILFHGSLIIHPPKETPGIASLGRNPNLESLAKALSEALRIKFQAGKWQKEELAVLSSKRPLG